LSFCFFLKLGKHTATSVLADVFQAFTGSFPVDGDGVVRIRLRSAAPHRSVDTVQHSVQSAASSLTADQHSENFRFKSMLGPLLPHET